MCSVSSPWPVKWRASKARLILVNAALDLVPRHAHRLAVDPSNKPADNKDFMILVFSS
jgi:hypothetical protein